MSRIALSRRHFLSAMAAPFALPAAAQRRPPNVVLILIDDYGWRDTGYNGSTFYETPNIDRLARSGVVFTDGYAASPVCSPTRAAIMTGKYPSRLHLTSHLQGASNRFHFTKVLQPSARLELPLEEVTIAELLRQQGYRTACIGKWHLGKTGFLPSDQGFDVSLAGDEAGSTNDFFFPAWKKKIPLDGAAGEYLTDRLTGLAVDFVESNKDRPFFLYLSHFAVHTPIQGKPDKVRKYDAKSRPDNPHNYGEYAAMIESVDESVGRVMNALRESSVEDSTLVIFTGDNGGLSAPIWKDRARHVQSPAPFRQGSHLRGWHPRANHRPPARRHQARRHEPRTGCQLRLRSDDRRTRRRPARKTPRDGRAQLRTDPPRQGVHGPNGQLLALPALQPAGQPSRGSHSPR